MTLLMEKNPDQVLKYTIEGNVTVSGKVELDVKIDNDMFLKLSPTLQRYIVKHLGKVE